VEERAGKYLKGKVESTGRERKYIQQIIKILGERS